METYSVEGSGDCRRRSGGGGGVGEERGVSGGRERGGTVFGGPNPFCYGPIAHFVVAQ